VRSPFFALTLLSAAWLAGCAGYQLGPTNGQPAGARSVQIDPFVNKTIEPQLSDYAMSSMRENLMRDGTFKMDTHGEGDIILTGVITEYNRIGVSYSPTDVITVVDYRITVTAQVKACERATGRVLFDRKVTGYAALRAGNDLPSAERQTLPLLMDDFAKKVTDLLADGGW
jgi:hypothetical protein